MSCSAPEQYRLYILNGKQNWFFHEKADVAVLTLNPESDIFDILINRAIPKECLFEEMRGISRDITLTIYGFPLRLGVYDRFSPISRKSKAASGLITIQTNDLKKATYFFLEDPAIQGYSGAPVFIIHQVIFLNGEIIEFSKELFKEKCIGLISGTLSDNTGGKLAAVVPASYIIETLNKANKSIENK